MGLAAVYSRSEEKGRALAERFGSPPVYTDLDRMAESDIDAVYIASPNILHEEHSRLFLEHGKHVLCEKPIAVTAAGLRQLQGLAEEKGLVYMEAIMLLHIAGRDVLHGAMEKIGRVTSARLDFFAAILPVCPSDGRRHPQRLQSPDGRGCLMDLGIYCVYAALDLFGKPEEVRTAASLLPTGADGSGGSLWTYPGTQVSLSYSKDRAEPAGLRDHRGPGTIVLESVSKLTGIRIVYNQNGDAPEENCWGMSPKRNSCGAKRQTLPGRSSAGEEMREEMARWSDIALETCCMLEHMRAQAGILFE